MLEDLAFTKVQRVLKATDHLSNWTSGESWCLFVVKSLKYLMTQSIQPALPSFPATDFEEGNGS